MDRNVKIAKELVKLAKSLVAEENADAVQTLSIGQRVEMTLIPMSCNSAGSSWYFPYKEQWNVHFKDKDENLYYLFTTSEATVKQAMANMNKEVKAKFIVAGIRPFEHCIRIKNLKIQD